MEPFQMKNGKWAYNFMYQGKRYRKQGMKTKKEAQGRIRTIMNEIANGIDANSNVLLDEHYERWIEVNKREVVTEKSYQRLLSVLSKIREFFPRNTRLKDLTRMDYQQFINYYAEGLSKESIKKIHGPLKACFDDAVYAGLITRNPAYKISIYGKVPPKEEKYKFMELDQYIKIKEHLSLSKSPSGLLLYILHATGARFSEVNGMKAHYLNPKENTVFLDGTKTESSKRKISIAESDMAHIIKKIDELGLNAAGSLFGMSYNAAEKTFAAAKSAIGIHDEITISSLRHTHCSFLYNHDISIDYISKRLGHKNIKITMEVYNHIFEERYELHDERAMELMDEMPSLQSLST